MRVFLLLSSHLWPVFSAWNPTSWLCAEFHECHMEFLALNELLCFFVAHPKKVSTPRSKYFLLMICLMIFCLMDVWMMIWWLHFFQNNKHYAARLFAIDPNCDNSCGCRWWLQITIFPVNQIILAYTYSTYSYWRLDIESYGDFPWPFSTQDFFLSP